MADPRFRHCCQTCEDLHQRLLLVSVLAPYAMSSLPLVTWTPARTEALRRHTRAKRGRLKERDRALAAIPPPRAASDGRVTHHDPEDRRVVADVHARYASRIVRLARLRLHQSRHT